MLGIMVRETPGMPEQSRLSLSDIQLPVSVLMSIYNNEAHLPAALDSILQQTFSDFELIAIDDCSTDGSWEILTGYAERDRRIRPIRNPENIGLTRSLNQGWALARGKYIARMDADDISLPSRFAKQVAFMEAHPKVGVCGTWTKTIGVSTRDFAKDSINPYPPDDKTIRCWLLFGVGLAHPAVFLRQELFLKARLSYDNSYRCCQDYNLWVRASGYFELANIPEVLLFYRLHPQQVGQTYGEKLRVSNNQRVWTILFKTLALDVAQEEFAIHGAIYLRRFQTHQIFVEQAERWLLKLKSANEKMSVYDELALAKFLGDRWFAICYAATGLGGWTWHKFWQSLLSQAVNLTWAEKLKFGLKCGINKSNLRDQFSG